MNVIKYRVDLYKLVPSNPVTCELGVAEGLFSEDILKRWNPSLHYAVDNWDTIEQEGYTGDGAFEAAWHAANYKAAQARFKPYKNKVKVLRGITWKMADNVKDESIDLLYIDAGHSFNAVMNDLEAWYAKVKYDGIIAGHDFLAPEYGVKEAVYTFCLNHGFEVNVIEENATQDAGFWFRKVKRNN